MVRISRTNSRLPLVLLLVLTMGALAAQPVPALVQPQSNPVYVDDSPAATESLQGIPDQLASGNLDGAVRVLQRLLDEEPERVAASATDPDLFISVRSRVHETLLASPKLLERYRRIEGPKAQRALEEGEVERVERSWLMTTAGLEAALRMAQRHLESARFSAAFLTLVQLEAHPDRRGATAADAAALLSAAAEYLNRPKAWEAAERWSRQAGAALNGRPARHWPEIASRTGQTPLEPTTEVELDGLVAKALWTVQVGPQGPPSRDGGGPGGDPLPPYARDLRVLPTVAGETIFVNDGTAVTAWDRFTLVRRWGVGAQAVADPTAADAAAARTMRGRIYRQAQPEDPSTVTVRGRTVAAVTGLSSSEFRREAEARLTVLDAESGRERWTSPVTTLDEQLHGGMLRAMPVIAQGTVVVAARKGNTNRRLTSLYLVGLAEGDGTLLWRRLVASAGSLPFGGRPAMPDGAVEDGGIVYIGDQIGVIAAYEAHSGRPVWVRRFDTQAWQAGESGRPWEINVPIVEGTDLLALSPDRREALRLNALSGQLLARRSTERLGLHSPRYLVRVDTGAAAGDELAGGAVALVGESRVALTSRADFPNGESRMPRRFTDPGIRGRVVAAGGRLLVPVAGGVALMDTARPSDQPRQIVLENPGNLLALASQLVVVDDGRMHSYLLWDAAERVLTERMRAEPRNPVPAVTFAELAYRAGRQERILAPVQAAIAALAAAPASDSIEGTRRRLFGSLLAMANASQEPAGLGSAAAAATAPAGDPSLRITDPALLGELIAAMGQVAVDAGERASQLMTLGRYQETLGQATTAVQTYQRVLDEPALAAATWSGPQMALRAELEATWRLQRLVNEHGAGIYAVHEAAAAEEIAALGLSPNVQQLETVARRYPVSAAAPEAWRRIAALHDSRGRSQAAISALEAGLRAASWRDDADPGLLGELAGRLVRALEGQGQIASAAEILRTLSAQHPDLALLDDAGEFDGAALLAELNARLAARHRWPRIGNVRAEGVQVIPGWQLLRQRVPDVTGTVGRCIALSNGDEVGVWAPSESGEFVLKWSGSIPGRGVDLVRIEDDNAYLFYDTRQGGVLEKVSATTGERLWQTAPFPEMFKDPAAAKPVETVRPVNVPRDRLGLLTDLILAMDERTTTLVERSGRAVGLDAQSGQVLWAGRVPLNLVIDTDLRGGLLIVAGDHDAPDAGPATGTSSVLVLDARTGQVLQRIGSRWGQPRWLRTLDGGVVLAGFEDAIVSLDAGRGETNWVLSDRIVQGSQEAWVVGDRLFLQDAGRAIWVASVTTGQLLPQAVRMAHTFRDEYRPIFASEVAPRREDGALIAFSASVGVALVAPNGEVVGTDALPDNEAVLPPLPASGRMVTIETVPFEHEPDGQMVFNIHQIETGTARLVQSRGLVLGARPNRLALLDDRIVLSAGSATIILQAPAERAAGR